MLIDYVCFNSMNNHRASFGWLSRSEGCWRGAAKLLIFAHLSVSFALFWKKFRASSGITQVPAALTCTEETEAAAEQDLCSPLGDMFDRGWQCVSTVHEVDLLRKKKNVSALGFGSKVCKMPLWSQSTHWIIKWLIEIESVFYYLFIYLKLESK